jgi:DUF1365 family protein
MEIDMTFELLAKVVHLDEAVRVADRLGLIGQKRVNWFAERAVRRDHAEEIRSSTTRVGPPSVVR